MQIVANYNLSIIKHRTHATSLHHGPYLICLLSYDLHSVLNIFYPTVLRPKCTTHHLVTPECKAELCSVGVDQQ